MSQLGGPGADITEMSPSKYPWLGILVKGILILVPIRYFFTSGCGFQLVTDLRLHQRDQLQLQQH
jgi:hypothetical protein